uniref:Protein Flattop n=1 Tax=Geospiza parvula TaxID=87175 RepID=A0A8C3QC77_GEOPR
MGGKGGTAAPGVAGEGPGGVPALSGPPPPPPPQYEDAFSPPRLQCWTLPTPHPPTPFIADDRGHLLPHVPRSKVSPWGTFLGTWAMPARIPPAWLDRSAREPRAAERLAREQPRALRRARNGIRTRVTGKVTPWGHTWGHTWGQLALSPVSPSVPSVPSSPSVPSPPSVPSSPSVPSVPSPPSVPSSPSVPSPPSVPSVPSSPSVPSLPSVPSPPSVPSVPRPGPSPAWGPRHPSQELPPFEGSPPHFPPLGTPLTPPPPSHSCRNPGTRNLLERTRGVPAEAPPTLSPPNLGTTLRGNLVP